MVWKMNLLTYLALISITLKGFDSKRAGKTLYFSSYTVEFDKTYIQDHRLKLQNTSVDVILNIARDFTQDPWIVTEIFVRERRKPAFRKLINYDVNVCHLLGKGDMNLITVWVQNFLKMGNLPRSCPIRKGNYSWYKIRPEKVNIPDVLPSAEYKVLIGTYFRNGKLRHSIDNLTFMGLLK
ncbi:uncharacterized protein LOC101887430 [Musca domestica]|uniref:Uncharacterized protein LOC101887430 n=2 Tax=Musca domestica TaxID=7370 RepID=A0A9J7D3B1_MUSDO|nr:uncharacterized protein LOC101887430 [Musca domestica]